MRGSRTTTTTDNVLIYYDEHKFFRQLIYQSIHHALNFHFLTTMVVIDDELMYISSSTLTRCLLAILVLYDKRDFEGNPETCHTAQKSLTSTVVNVDDDIYINMASMKTIVIRK